MVAKDLSDRKDAYKEVIRNGLVFRDDAIEAKNKTNNKYRSKFLRAAEHGITAQTNLGPTLHHAVEEVMTKYQDEVVFNDKISFFRMEYFLY